MIISLIGSFNTSSIKEVFIVGILCFNFAFFACNNHDIFGHLFLLSWYRTGPNDMLVIVMHSE